MVSKTLTISCPEHLLEFLNENPGLSASKVFQGALINIQDSVKSNPQLIECNTTVRKLEKVIERIQTDLNRAITFIEKENLWKEFKTSLYY